MIFYLFLCNILFIPLIFCNNATVSKSDINSKTESVSHNKKLSNETKVALLSEGGSIVPETLEMALPKLLKDNFTSLGNDVGKNKVVPRKGVIYTENSKKSQGDEHTTIPSITSGDKSKVYTELLATNTTAQNDKSTLPDNIISTTKNASETVTHKKPLILYSDVLEKMTVTPSSSTPVKEPIQSSKNGVKTYFTNANKHPGMVMPIVITILLVPMFAVLGYMALRRGQEAWKNRHYKRMDFLLDGMYND